MFYSKEKPSRQAALYTLPCLPALYYIIIYKGLWKGEEGLGSLEGEPRPSKSGFPLVLRKQHKRYGSFLVNEANIRFRWFEDGV